MIPATEEPAVCPVNKLSVYEHSVCGTTQHKPEVSVAMTYQLLDLCVISPLIISPNTRCLIHAAVILFLVQFTDCNCGKRSGGNPTASYRLVFLGRREFTSCCANAGNAVLCAVL
jgi:hypothetical protein